MRGHSRLALVPLPGAVLTFKVHLSLFGTESVHAMKQVRMKKLEQIRLEVDSRRRTVLDLSMKVSSLPLFVSARLLSCTSEPLCACLGSRPLQVLFNAYVNIAAWADLQK